MLMSPNKDETAVHGCHCQDDMAVRMRKVLQTAGLVSECVICFFRVKLGNIVAETLLRMQMFPSLAARGTYVAATNFAARKQENVFASNMFLT